MPPSLASTSTNTGTPALAATWSGTARGPATLSPPTGPIRTKAGWVPKVTREKSSTRFAFRGRALTSIVTVCGPADRSSRPSSPRPLTDTPGARNRVPSAWRLNRSSVSARPSARSTDAPAVSVSAISNASGARPASANSAPASSVNESVVCPAPSVKVCARVDSTVRFSLSVAVLLAKATLPVVVQPYPGAAGSVTAKLPLASGPASTAGCAWGRSANDLNAVADPMAAWAASWAASWARVTTGAAAVVAAVAGAVSRADGRMRVPTCRSAFISAPATWSFEKSGRPRAWPYSCSSTVSRSKWLAASVPVRATNVPSGPATNPLASPRYQPTLPAVASRVMTLPL